MSRASEILNQTSESAAKQKDIAHAEKAAFRMRLVSNMAWEIEKELTDKQNIGKAVKFLGLQKEAKALADKALAFEDELHAFGQKCRVEAEKKAKEA